MVLRGFGMDALVAPLDALPPPPAGAATAGVDAARPLRVTFVSRRPYRVAGIDHGFIGRQVDNEDSLLDAARAALAASGAVLQRVDLAPMPVPEQVALVARTDILIAMHGAALSWAALLPPHAAVLELWPKDGDMWRCFEHLAAMAGLAYERWANPDPARFRADDGGDYTRVDEAAVADILRRLVATVDANVRGTLAGTAKR